MGLERESGIVIDRPITPIRFFQRGVSGVEASRKCYKHGDFVALSQPRTQWQAYQTKEIPLAIRARDFSRLGKMQEEDINFVGYTWYPVQGKDRRKRVVPFVWVPEAVRLFAYAENMTGGIEVKSYEEARRVKTEGAEAVCRVPSRTRKRGRYTLKLNHVPIDGSTERRAVCWSLRSQYAEGQETLHSQYNIRYTYEMDREASDVFTFYPQDIAAYIAVIKHFNAQHNLTPIEMSPLALPSQKTMHFYNKLCNNVLVHDDTLDSKDKLRKLHIDEKSILIARSMGVYGHDATLFWDPARDGRLKDYPTR